MIWQEKTYGTEDIGQWERKFAWLPELMSDGYTWVWFNYYERSIKRFDGMEHSLGIWWERRAPKETLPCAICGKDLFEEPHYHPGRSDEADTEGSQEG